MKKRISNERGASKLEYVMMLSIMFTAVPTAIGYADLANPLYQASDALDGGTEGIRPGPNTPIRYPGHTTQESGDEQANP